ncbi:MAG: hypothetical protein WBB94_02360 [Candidatus Saccharimonadaceae bacterium]
MKVLKLIEKVVAIVGAIASLVMLFCVTAAVVDQLDDQDPDPDDYYGQKDEV